MSSPPPPFGPPAVDASEPPLWTPTRQQVLGSQLFAFGRPLAPRLPQDIGLQDALHIWSTDRPGDFWDEVWRWAGVVGDRGDGPALVLPDAASVAADPASVFLSARWFPDARLSYAENLLAGAGAADDVEALVFVREDDEPGQVRRRLTFGELREASAAFAAFLRSVGVGPGDRVAAWLPNVPETVVAMLGANLVGAVFTSTSPDFGVAGVLDRFGQVEPTVLVAGDGYVYAGRQHDRLERLAEVVAGLPTLRATVVVGELAERPDLDAVAGLGRAWHWADVLADHAGATAEAVRLPFDHPGFVLYSSGTTGPPKCIVHRGAGVLLKHLVEHRLHCDIRPGDRVMYFTTCGWMMWNWLVSVLASGATAVLYDGSPTAPTPARLWDLADQLEVTLFGTSAKYLDSVAKAGVRPVETHRLAPLRTITSTGSPLSADGFRYVYEWVKPDVHLASISGGTDLVGCFVCGDPTRPVYAGEIQGPALGMAVDVWDEAGASLWDKPGERGELVCATPFPTVPVGFWGDADGSRLRAAYFERFPGVWAHGDFASWTDHRGFVIHGRSDATLNAGGVRIGTAEIYRQVERLPEVAEALAIGQEWDDDTRIVLFLRLADGATLDDRLAETVRRTLRENCSPRHVPARIVAVPDLPRTRSGKLAELAVADVVHGRPVRNTEALANPESLAAFKDLPVLAE